MSFTCYLHKYNFLLHVTESHAFKLLMFMCCSHKQDMQLLLLKYREEIISAKVAKEHTEESLRSEILFLKDQVVSEQQEKTTMEETLTTELHTLQEKLGVNRTHRRNGTQCVLVIFTSLCRSIICSVFDLTV